MKTENETIELTVLDKAGKKMDVLTPRRDLWEAFEAMCEEHGTNPSEKLEGILRQRMSEGTCVVPPVRGEAV